MFMRSAGQEESRRTEQGQGRNDAKLGQESQSGAEKHGHPPSRKPRLELAQEQAPRAPETETRKHQLQDPQVSGADNLQTITAKT